MIMRSRNLALALLALGAIVFAMANAGWWHGAGLLILFAGYAVFVWSVWRRPQTPSIRVALFVAFMLVAVFGLVPPQGSTDVYSYQYFARLVGTYGVNPHTLTAGSAPDAILDDVVFQRTEANRPFATTYGPLWTSVALLIDGVQRATQMDATILFRLLAVVGLAICALLLWFLLPAAGSRPAVLALFLWNPFILYEVVNNGHNDIFVAVALLASVAAFRWRKELAVMPILAIGAALKYVPVLGLLPALVLLVRQRRYTQLMFGAVLAAAILLMSVAPYSEGWGTVRPLARLGLFTALPVYHPVWLMIKVLDALGAPQPEMLARLLGLLILLSLVAIVLAKLSRGMLRYTTSLILLMGGFVAFGTTYFQPWYVVWVLPLIFLEAGRWPKWVVLSLTALGLGTGVWY